jgi:hypothetical protein
LITSVNISFSNRIDDILCCFLRLFQILSKLLHEEVVANELIIKNGSTQL